MVVVKPDTYFVKVEDAFPDVVDDYWFFLDEDEKPGDNYKVMAGSAGMKLADIDNDGLPEIIMAHSWGPGKNEYRAKVIPYLWLAESSFEIYDYQDSKFHNVTDLYFTSEPLVASYLDGMESKRAEIDINQDGQIDIFYSANQEDGASRLAEHGGWSAPLVGLISQFDGTYEIYYFGERKWWHNIKVGRDEQGIPYVVAAGFVENGVRDNGSWNDGVTKYTDNLVQNETYYWDHNTNNMVTQTNDNFPDIFAGGKTIMLSRYGDFTDLVVQVPAKMDLTEHRRQTGEWVKLALQAYYLDQPYGKWQKTPITQLPKELIGTIQFRNWNGGESVQNVYDFNGLVGYLDHADMSVKCSFTLYKNQPPVIFATAAIIVLPDFQEGDLTVVNEGDGDLSFASIPYFAELQNGEISLVPVEIDDFDPHMPNEGLECYDVNNDGYDDIIVPSYGICAFISSI